MQTVSVGFIGSFSNPNSTNVGTVFYAWKRRLRAFLAVLWTSPWVQSTNTNATCLSRGVCAVSLNNSAEFMQLAG
jgi:hypothetical protein